MSSEDGQAPGPASTRAVLTRQVVVWGVSAVGAAILVWALPAAVRFAEHAPSEFWAMAIGALVVDIPLFGLTGPEDLRVRSTLTVCFTFAIFVVWGPAPAVVVQAVSGAVTVVGQRYRPRSGLYLVARLICAVAVAEVVADLINPHPITHPGTGLDGRDLLTFVLLAAVWFGVSYLLLVVARATVQPGGVRQATVETRVDVFSTATTVLVVSSLLTTVRGWPALLLLIPLVASNGLARQQLRHEAQLHREPVSGLLTRQGLAGGLRAITAYDLIDPRSPRQFGIILINVESVLAINRAFGRDIYEEVVGAASRRIIDIYGEDRVGRLSGEGIAVLVPDLTEHDSLREAESAVQALIPGIEVEEIPFALDPAAGVALSPQHGRDLGTLLAKAELAVSEARRRNRRAMLYVREAAEVASRRIVLLRELRSVLRDPQRRAEIGVLYQPQVEVATGRLRGVEALVRWNHPAWGPVPTDELIETVEPTEVMHLLTVRVLELASGQLRRWQEEGRALRVAVNVSVRDLHEPEFVDELTDLISTTGIPPDQLTVEITERMLIQDAPRVTEECRRIARLGLGMSLDDFGTGYASLQQLRLLPLTEVKVDQTYVRGIVDNPADRAILGSVHQLARALNVGVVAEGVEDARIHGALAEFAGLIGQGWYYGRPMTADELGEWDRSRPIPDRHPTSSRRR